MAKIVFILGAGASAQGGCPVMNNFIEIARGLRFTLRDQRFVEAFDRVSRLQQLLQRANSKSVMDTQNIESVFSALEMAIALGHLADERELWLLETRKCLLSLIAWTLESTQEYLMQASADPERRFINSGPNGYRELASLVHEAQRSEYKHQFGFVTFNYDCGLEFALSSAGLPYTYCLTAMDPWNKAIPVCKLHGSLSWVQAKDASGASNIESIDPISIPPPVTAAAGRVVAQCRTTDALRIKFGEEALPFIVPPTDAKADARRLMTPVWHRAGELLREAENIIVVGYSLPPSDQFFRTFFALCMSSDTILRRLWIFDLSGDPLGRFVEILGPSVRGRQGVLRHFPSQFGQMQNQLNDIFRPQKWLL